MQKVLLLNGPNLNLLGRREPAIYGHTRLTDIEQALRHKAAAANVQLDCLQSNAEHVLIDRIHATLDDGTDFIIFNPAAFTHTSLALRDALLAVQTPFVEVHLSDLAQRERYRQHSWFSDIADCVISGHGAAGYEMAWQHVMNALNKPGGVAQ